MQKLKLSFLLAIVVATTRLLQAQTIESYTFTTNRLVPDGDASGLSDVRSVPSAIGQITSLSVRLKITGEFNGDIYGYLRHSSGFTVLLNRPGKTAANDFGYADSGFNVTFQTGATNGDVHIYENSMTPAAGFPLTGFWQPDGRNVDPATVTDASPRTTSLTNFNNLNATGTWTLYLADVASGGTNMLTEWGIDITGSARPTLIWPNPADIVYGAALGGSQLNATATHNSTNVPGTFSYSTAVGAILAAGLGQTLSVTFTPIDTNSFLSITTNVTINVAQAPLTITAVNANKVYGAALPTLTTSYSGFVNGDTVAGLGTGASLSTTANASSPVGTYTITIGGAIDSNYIFNYVVGTLTITQSLSSSVIVSSANPSLPGTNVTFTTTLSAVAPGAGTPSGTVNFRIDGSVAASGALSGGGARFTINSLALGSHTVTAEYAGDLNFVGTTNALAQEQFVDTPPVTGNVTIERYPSQGVKVFVATLLANDTDPDSNALTFISVSATSTSGGTNVLQGNWVFYQPPLGFTNSDSFSYVIGDSSGLQATGSVSVATEADPGPSQNIVAIVDLGGNNFSIQFLGIPVRVYTIQYTTNLATPSWQPLGAGTADATGSFSYVDTLDQGSPPRFYRSTYP